MSSRLIISGKKSYCPWSAKNVAKVERDEAASRQRQANRVREQHARDAEARLLVLKGNAEETKGDGHVNLFAREEQREADTIARGMQQQQHDSSAVATDAVVTRSLVPVATIHPGNSRKRPFYLRDDPFAASSELSAREQARLARDDPMAQYVNRHRHDSSSQAIVVRGAETHHGAEDSNSDSTNLSESSERKRTTKRQKKEKRHKKKHKKVKRKQNNQHQPTMSELRQRRVAREEAEQQRQVELNKVERRPRRRYQDQYHPDLAKR